MLTLCFFYCVPFAKFIYFAFAFLLFLFGLLVLRRGIYRARLDLRQLAFFIMFAAGVKLFIFDLRMLEKDILCRSAIALLCGRGAFAVFEVLGLVLLVGYSYMLLRFYRHYLALPRPDEVTPEKVHLRLWVNGTFFAVMAMVVSQFFPLVGALLGVQSATASAAWSWQPFAALDFILIFICFWKMESCAVGYRNSRRGRYRRIRGSWTSKEVLWTTTFVYLITLALSYAVHDVMR